MEEKGLLAEKDEYPQWMADQKDEEMIEEWDWKGEELIVDGDEEEEEKEENGHEWLNEWERGEAQCPPWRGYCGLCYALLCC